MPKQLKTVIILMVGLLFFVACETDHLQQENGSGRDQNASITDISDLSDTDYFQDGALKHILEGEINHQGDAVGFHYEDFPTTNGQVVKGTETKPNEYGVYEARIEVDGTAKTSNGGKSTLFPKEWDGQQVVNAINDAYTSKTSVSGDTYEGLTSDGMIIRMYLDERDRIISAFPIY